MTAAFVVVVALAWILQVLFSVLYWRWIPTWVKDPYGRLAQLGSWCHIIPLTFYLSLVSYGKYFNPTAAGVILILCFFPLVFFGFLQLVLLKRAVDLARVELAKKKNEEVEGT